MSANLTEATRQCLSGLIKDTSIGKRIPRGPCRRILNSLSGKL